MKTKTKLMNVVTFSLRMGLVAASAVFLQHNATAQITPIPYGDASSFAILAHSGVTDVPNFVTTIHHGSVGVYPLTSVTGLLPIQVPDGHIYVAGTGHDVLLNNASIAASNAFDVAAGETPTPPNLGLELGGVTLGPGVYTFDSGTVLLDGTLTLNAYGAPDPIWIFQVTSDLTTKEGAPGSLENARVVVNGGVACDVLWRVPTLATIGSYSEFVGTIIAGTSITMHTGATLHGRAWALNGDVTMDQNTIDGLPCTSLGAAGGEGGGGTGVPDTASTLLLLGCGLATLLGFGRRFRSLI